MKQFIKTTKYICVDTKQLIPHLECYIIKENNHLYAEQITGQHIDLGKIIKMSDIKEDIEEISYV